MSTMSTLQSFFTQSTIYNRHEARRSKTLQKQAKRNGDHHQQPAVIRILAQIGGAASMASSSSAAKGDSVPASSRPEETMFSGLQDDETVFTAHPATLRDGFHAKNLGVNTVSTAAAAALGARVADSYMALTTSSSTHSSGLLTTKPTATTTTTTDPHILHMVRGGSSAMALHLPNSVPGRTTSSGSRRVVPRLLPLALRTSVASSPKPSPLFVSPSVAPFAILFGVQAWLESQWLLQQNDDDATPASMAAMAAAGVAGATVGMVRSIGLQKVNLGSEASAAILYFGSYRLLKSALTTGSEKDNVLAIGAAGAVAGTLYEVTRVYGPSSSSTQLALGGSARPHWSSPFATTQLNSTALVARRAAPAHAIFFLAFEAARSVLLADDRVQ